MVSSERKEYNDNILAESYRYNFGRKLSMFHSIAMRLMGKEKRTRLNFAIAIAEMLDYVQFDAFLGSCLYLVDGFNTMDRMKIFDAAREEYPLLWNEQLDIMDEIISKYSKK